MADFEGELREAFRGAWNARNALGEVVEGLLTCLRAAVTAYGRLRTKAMMAKISRLVQLIEVES